MSSSNTLVFLWRTLLCLSSSKCGNCTAKNQWMLGKPPSRKGGWQFGGRGAWLPKANELLHVKSQMGIILISWECRTAALCTPPTWDETGRESSLWTNVFLYQKSSISQCCPLPKNLKSLQKRCWQKQSSQYNSKFARGWNAQQREWENKFIISYPLVAIYGAVHTLIIKNVTFIK